MRLTPTAGRHSGTINIAVTWELNYWATRLGLSPDQLIAVVAEVGNDLADVREAVFGPAPRGFGEARDAREHRDPLAGSRARHDIAQWPPSAAERAVALDLFFVPHKQDFADARRAEFEASDAQLRARRKLLKAMAARFDGAAVAGKATDGAVEGFPSGTLVAHPGYLHWSLHGADDTAAIAAVVDWFREQGLVCEDPQEAGFGNRERGSGRENLRDWNVLVGARLAGIELSDPGISGLNLSWALGDGRLAQLCFVHHRSCEVPPDLTALIRDTIAEVVFTPGALDDDVRFVFAGGAEIRCAGAVAKSFFAEPAPKSKW